MQKGTAPPPSSVHVLFVHGVGQHSRLSSLMQAYQAVRSNLRSPEAPSALEDPIPGWRLIDFNDNASPPYLKLVNRLPGNGPAELYFYEINYSQLAGVVRANQPLDITRLFVGFDLAVNWSRTRLIQDAGTGNKTRDVKIARVLQRLSGIFAGVTVPVLGLPSLLLRNYTNTFVGNFRRFFEDIATFAMDRNGQQLISAHMDRTVQDIFESDAFRGKIRPTDGDNQFVIAAHSLGTVVAHNYLVRQWLAGGTRVPSRFLTFGSPIGLVCWVWLFLDFRRMLYVPESQAGVSSEDEKEQLLSKYFCWAAGDAPETSPKPLQWINVINHLDPIATAFGAGCVDMSMKPADIAPVLEGGDILHRFIKTGDLRSVGASHTQYFDDQKEGDSFIELLVQVARMRAGDPAKLLQQRDGAKHWGEMARDLRRLRVLSAGLGIALIFGYVAALLCKFNYDPLDLPWYAILPLALYCWPALTVGALAWGQRFIYGGPTKRTSEARIKQLAWWSLSSFPYKLRQRLQLDAPQGTAVEQVRDARMTPGPSLLKRVRTFVFEFVPTLVGMLVPIAIVKGVSGQGWNPFPAIWADKTYFTWLAVLFIIYLVCFSISEFIAAWRDAVRLLFKDVLEEKKGP